MKHFLSFIAAFSIVYSLAIAPAALAAELYFGAHAKEAGAGETFEVGVFVGTEGETINAISGSVIFPNDLVELKYMKDAGSLMNLWLERSQGSGAFTFSGIIPGGFAGPRGYLFSLVFTSKTSGKARFSMKDMAAYLHNGEATQTRVLTSPLDISFVRNPKTSPSALPDDSDPPETFSPQIVRDPDVFEDKYFLIFQTQDKSSGMNHYEVKEGGSDWEIAKSPYLLKDQEQKNPIFVKAVDNAGNERIESIVSQKPLDNAYIILFTVIVAITVLIIVFLRQRRVGVKG